MEVREFEKFSKRVRLTFRRMLIKGENINEQYKTFFKSIIDECGSNFELETMKEILKEEFQNYLTSLQNEESEA